MAEHYYTIKDIEEMTGIPATAIRFYDKRGLLVFVKRSPNGMRIFTDRDVEKIRLIQLLRNLDMPVNVISRYIGLVQQGDASRPERRRMIASHIAELEDHLRALQEAVEAAKCVEAALADKDVVLPPPRKILGYLRNWSIFSPENRLPLLFHTAGSLKVEVRDQELRVTSDLNATFGHRPFIKDRREASLRLSLPRMGKGDRNSGG